MAENEIVDVPLDLIDPFVNQSRERFDEAEIEALWDNIKVHGLLQHGVGWFDPGRGRYTLLCGERRLRALRLGKQPTMPLKVLRGPMTQGEMLAVNLAENLQRASLNPIEQAKAFKRLMKLESLSASDVAARMNVSNATVSNTLSLLKLPDALQADVASGGLPVSVAASVARLDDSDMQRALADRYASGELNRDGVAEVVKQLRGADAAAAAAERPEGRKPTRPKATQHSFRLGGVAFTVTCGKKPLSLDVLLPAIRQLAEAAERLKESGGSVAGLASSLKAS